MKGNNGGREAKGRSRVANYGQKGIPERTMAQEWRREISPCSIQGLLTPAFHYGQTLSGVTEFYLPVL